MGTEREDVGPHSDGAVALAPSLGVVRYFVQMGLGCTQAQPIGGYYPGSPLSSSDHTGALLWSSSGSKGVGQCLIPSSFPHLCLGGTLVLEKFPQGGWGE